WDLAEVLGFIDHDRDRPAIADSLLYGVSVLCADRLRRRHEPRNGSATRPLRWTIKLVVDQWLVKLVKESLVVIAPIKAAGLRSYGFHTDYGIRVQSLRSSLNISAVISCSVFSRNVVLPTPV